MNKTKVSEREIIYSLYLHDYFLFYHHCMDISADIQMCQIYSCTDDLFRFS